MAPVYLKYFKLPSENAEYDFLLHRKQTCYSGEYPYRIFPNKGLERLDFAPVTMLYGGNGSGKTTLLNVIAENLNLVRSAPFNGSAFFTHYAQSCDAGNARIPPGSRILTSDDVFDTLLSIRTVNEGIDRKRDDLLGDYLERKWNEQPNLLRSLDDFDEFRTTLDARRRTQSRFVKDRLPRNVDSFSNGETAMHFFTQNITQNALYLLDEPENSLSVEKQSELCEFLYTSARYMCCQFIISTHSPVLLSMRDARIYDLGSLPVSVKPWTELGNVRKWFDFFLSHRDDFARDANTPQKQEQLT